MLPARIFAEKYLQLKGTVMDINKKIAVILLCTAVIAAVLFFTKADINHGHGLADHTVTQTTH